MLLQGWEQLEDRDIECGMSAIRELYGWKYDWIGVASAGLFNTRRFFCSEIVHRFGVYSFARPETCAVFPHGVWPWRDDEFFTPNDALSACGEPLGDS